MGVEESTRWVSSFTEFNVCWELPLAYLSRELNYSAVMTTDWAAARCWRGGSRMPANTLLRCLGLGPPLIFPLFILFLNET